ncbi:NAD(P)/FAD-dependent oxidoreductase [Haloimpatiens sp. FM7330]|uniref:NAD(P)/FAD-dependent oxidoreductase n=1 Tax=Haloimpatiens sp. FM7330 TaxID=3298610 RepID=UPI0036442B78
MDYDVLILGGSMVGCAIAYELSKYSLNIALIEKDYDIADDISLVNTAIVYDGLETEEELMAKLEINSNRLFNNLTKKFNVPFKKMSSLILARNEDEEEKLQKIYSRGIKRGINDIALLSNKYIYEIEPNLNIKAKKAIYSQNTGIVCPYNLAIAYGEIAFDNGVKFKLEEEVKDIQKSSKGYKVITNKNKFTCKIVINTTPSEKYSIDFRKKDTNYRSVGNIKYFLLDKSFCKDLSNIVFMMSEKGGRIAIIPTFQENSIIAMYSKKNIDYQYFINQISNLVGDIDEKYINNFYESDYYNDNILIDDSCIDKGYIKIDGKHYAQVTMTPFIAKMICETVVSNMNCKLNKDFTDKRREFYRFRDLSNEEREKVIQVNKKYGKIVCACQKVTEGEIIDAIRRPLGARTVEGVKRRTGAAYGSCQGSNCINKIVSILARETNKNITDIVKDSKESKILLSRIKEFDEI